MIDVRNTCFRILRIIYEEGTSMHCAPTVWPIGPSDTSLGNVGNRRAWSFFSAGFGERGTDSFRTIRIWRRGQPERRCRSTTHVACVEHIRFTGRLSPFLPESLHLDAGGIAVEETRTRVSVIDAQGTHHASRDARVLAGSGQSGASRNKLADRSRNLSYRLTLWSTIPSPP